VRGCSDPASTAGVGAFVGCIGSPSDRKAGRVGYELHRALLNGEPVARALHQARRLANEDDTESLEPTELLYVVYGYPELALAQVLFEVCFRTDAVQDACGQWVVRALQTSKLELLEGEEGRRWSICKSACLL
jgi:hypothetical protein